MPFTRLLNNVNKIVNDIDNITVGAMMEVKEEIIDLNTSQLEAGKLSTDKNLDSYTSDAYARFKKSIGSKSSPIADLKLTGDFYSGFNVQFKSDSLVFDSSDSKAPNLEKEWSKDIYGLTNKNKSEVSEMILPTIQNKILNGFIK